MSVATDLRDRVLNLAPAERAELARDLILSLDPTPANPNADQAWEMEILRRADAVDRGEAQTVAWEDAVDRARAGLKRPESK